MDEGRRHGETVTISCRGHPNIRASHAKTLELTGDGEITSAGTCIVGVSCRYDEEALLGLRGSVRIRLTCGAIEDALTARVNPLFRRGDPLIVRRGPEPAPRTFCIAASKGSSMLDRRLVAALAEPGAELAVTVEPLASQSVERGVLFIVGMPIGNEADISLRALDVLASVDSVAAEDTRTVRAFLDRHGIRCSAVSFHDHNERTRTPQLLQRLAAGERIALVSEAGMPLVSDPGFNLVRAAHEEEILVTVVPGPDAVTASLAVSGIAPHDFRFIGFLPRKKGARRRLLATLAPASYTTVFFEAPHRILETLDDLEATLGERPVVVCKNLTKFGEAVLRGTARNVRETIAAGGEPRGELAVVVAGAGPPSEDDEAGGISAELARMVEALIEEGLPTKTIAAALAGAAGWSRREAYDYVVRIR